MGEMKPLWALILGLGFVVIAFCATAGILWQNFGSQLSRRKASHEVDPPVGQRYRSRSTAQLPTDRQELEKLVSRLVKPWPGEEPFYTEARRRMLLYDLAGRDINNLRVLEAMGKVPRQLFVSDELRREAYADGPLPIGYGQTISQPYIVALMTQLADPQPEDRALDIGTGSGYQAAVLAELCKEVYSIEIIKPLAEQAAERLKRLGYKNIFVRHGDGYRGWPEKAPFDVIIVAAAPDHIPKPLVDQLAPGGKLVIPVGEFFQELVLVEKRSDGTINKRSIIPVRFVPMTGEAQQHSNNDVSP